VVLALACLLLQAAWPSWRAFMRNQAVKAAAAQWMACLARARSEALQSGAEVAVLPMPGGWASGWAVARDANGNGVLDTGETRLHVYGPAPQAMTTQINFGKQALLFQGTGRPGQAGNVMLELEGVRRKLIVNMLGRVRLCDPDSAKNC
jgi:type IV fimbrial biogenesis protein FimT